MDLAIRFPTQGRIHLESRFLFSEPHDPNCRRFLERVFQAPEITQVTIRSQEGSSEVPRAELGFCPRTHTLKEVVDRVTGLLNPGKVRSGTGLTTARDGRTVLRTGLPGPTASAGSNGRASSNGHVAQSNGRASSNGHVTLQGAVSGSSHSAVGTPGSDHHLDHAGP